MVKKVYLQSTIKWALGIALLVAGTPTFLYFAYSNEIGAITITGKSWTDYCNATSWDEKSICYAYFNFTANEDTFWYPVDYDAYGRSTPYSFDPNVREWKLERKWGNGWREIPLTKPCIGTWCGGKRGIPALYSVAWRQGQRYETRISAIKQNADDNIIWSFGLDDPVWFGIDIRKLESCVVETNIKKVYVYEKNDIFFNQTICSDEPVNSSCFVNTIKITVDKLIGNYNDLLNTSICKMIGLNISNKVINWQKEGWKCKWNLLKLTCDSVFDGNGDGICTSGESCIEYDLSNLNEYKKSRIDIPSLKRLEFK